MTILITLLLLVFGLRIWHQIVFYDLGFDKMRQIPAAGHFARGNGIADCTVAVNNLAEITCQPQNWWASGYPIVLGWLYYFTGDFIVSDYILIILALLVLFFSVVIIFNSLDHSLKTDSPLFLFLLFSAFSFTPYHYLPTTELLSLAFVVAGWAAFLRIIKGHYLSAGFLGGLLFFSAGFFKYSYYPFLVTLPLTLSVIFMLTRRKQLIYSIVVYSATVLSGFGLLRFLFPDHLINSWIEDYSRGWHWHNLLQIDVFPVRAFFFIDPILSRLEVYSGLDLMVNAGLSAVSFLIAAGFITYTFYCLKKTYFKEIAGIEAYFYLLGCITLLINIGYLVWISARLVSMPQQNNPNWTFVWETRFYSPSMLFLQIFLFCAAFRLESPAPRLTAYLKALALVPVVCAVAYFSFKYFDIFVNKRLDGTYYAESADKIKVGNYLKENLPKESPPAVLTFVNYGEGYGANRLKWDYQKDASLSLAAFGEGATRFHWDFNKSGNLLRTDRPVTLFFIMRRNLNESESKFVSDKKASLVLRLSDSDLYRMEVKP